MSVNLTGYHLVFDDEFDASTYVPGQETGATDPLRETIFNGSSTYGGENYTGGDGGLGTYLSGGGKQPISESGGTLNITASPNVAGNTGSNYNTGLVDSRYGFALQPNGGSGYIEMRVQDPAGAGFWPGQWTQPEADPAGDGTPEVDIGEEFGAAYGGIGGSNQIHYDLHDDSAPSEGGNWATVSANIYTSFNTYGVQWTPTSLNYYFDGSLVATLATPSDMTGSSAAEYVVSSLLTGSPGDWPGPMAGETGTMKVDYIRAYSTNTTTNPAVVQQTQTSPDGNDPGSYGATDASGHVIAALTGGGGGGGGTYPTATINGGTPVSINGTGVTSAGDTFNLVGAAGVSAVLGTAAQTIQFAGGTATGGVAYAVQGGSGAVTLSAAPYISATAGTGTLKVDGSLGGDIVNISTNLGVVDLLNDAGHANGDSQIYAPTALMGKIRAINATFGGNTGTMYQEKTGSTWNNSVFLDKDPGNTISLVSYH